MAKGVYMKVNFKQKLQITLAIKMVVGFILAFLIAYFAGLDPHYPAGVFAVLSMALTREEVFVNALKRGLASLIGLVIATLFFLIPIPRVYSLILIVITLLPLLVFTKLDIGAVLALSAITTLYLTVPGDNQDLFAQLFNVIYLLIIGIGIAVIFNFIHVDVEKDVHTITATLENGFKKFGEQIINNEEVDFKLLYEKQEQAKEALTLAKKTRKASFVARSDEYLQMRMMHIRLLEAIMEVLQSLGDSHHKDVVVSFLNDVLKATGNNHEVFKVNTQLQDTYAYFAKLPLPKERKEFEHRAELFSILKDLEIFIRIEIDWLQKHLSMPLS